MDTPSLDAYARVFWGRTDVFAEGHPNPKNPAKYSYHKVDEPLTPQLLDLHLTGATTLGVYPIRDGKVGWWAVDFDAPKDSDGRLVPNAFAMAWTEAVRQAEAFERAGLLVELERSRSGNGVHLWGFLSEPLDAETVLRAIRPHMLPAVSLDRVYPLQKAVKEGGYGNLISLPYSGLAAAKGNSVFMDRELRQPLALDAFLAEVKFNHPDVIRELAGNAPPEQPGATAEYTETQLRALRPPVPLRGWLKAQSKFGCKFLHHAWADRRVLPEPEWYAAVQQATCFAEGRNIAHLISRDHPGYDYAVTEAKYSHALASQPVGCSYIHANYPEHACGDCPMGRNGRMAPYHVATRDIMDLVRQGTAPMERATFTDHLQRVQRRQTGQERSGIAWQLPSLDRITTLRPAELTVVGAMPSMGKTALLVDAACRMANAGTHVLVFSAETERDSLHDRLVAHEAEVDSRALRGERTVPGTNRIDPLTDNEWKRVEDAVSRLNGLPLYENYTDVSANQVLANIERVLVENRIGFDEPYVVLFDYLQFGQRNPGESDNNYDHISRLSSEFKNVAKITNHPIVVFSQLIRKAETTDDAPSMVWFKESGRIEQDLDVGIILTGDRVEGVKAPRRMHIVKQREGSSQAVLSFVLHQAISRFDEAASAATTAPTDGLEAMRPDLLVAEDDPWTL